MKKEEKPDILKDYTFIKNIGEGNFGKVKLAVLNSTNENYAIKILNKEKLKSQTKSSSYNEIEIISKLNHQNIVHVEKILDDEKNYYIIMEYCDKGELFDYIVNKERLDQVEASYFFYQLINGVDYLHENCFVHRDLKPENLLLTKNNILKIIDFGLCHDFDGTKLLKTKCGSPSYAAPEILLGYKYDGFKSDIWCCGIILYGMLCGFLPFDGDNNQEIFEQIIECKPEFPSFLVEDSVDLLVRLLNPNPKERLSIEQIKNHPFYLKGKDNFLNQQEQNEEIIKFFNENFKNNDNSLGTEISDYDSGEKKNYGFSSIKKRKEAPDVLNSIKTLKKKKGKKKHNIYENIFNDILVDEDNNNDNLINNIDDSNNDDNDKNDYENDNENEKDQNDKESDKYDKTQKRKINEIAGLINKTKKEKIILQTEGNQEKRSYLIGAFKNKDKGNKLKINPNKLLFHNKNSLRKKLDLINFSKSNSNPKKKDNEILLNLNILNSGKKHDNKNIFKNFDKNNNKILEENVKKNLREKHNIKELKLNPQKLDFFQKFLINKRKNINQGQIFDQSPIKAKGLNFNLILSREKERIEREHKSNSENKNDVESNKKMIIKRQLSEKENEIHTKDNSLFSQKRKKSESAKKRIILHSEINLATSPGPNNTIYPHRNKNYYSLFGSNSIFRGKMSEKSSTNKSKYGCNSCSVRKNHRTKKINNDKKLNLRIINLNIGKNLIKKEIRKYKVKSQNNKKSNDHEIIMNKNKNNLNAQIKTEPKYNQFLDKVINKLNVKKSPKIINNMNIISINKKNKNEDNNIYMIKNYISNLKEGGNKRPFRKFNFERNNNQNIIKYFKNNSKDEKNKNSPNFLERDKKYILSNNPKILDKNVSPKDKLKLVFPNVAIYNKNI